MNAPYQPKLKPVFTIFDVRAISVQGDAIPNGLVDRDVFVGLFWIFQSL